MASHETPKRMKKNEECVFKTPMTFSPALVGSVARPSPSRIELWKEELGLTDDSDLAMDSPGGATSDSDCSLGASHHSNNGNTRRGKHRQGRSCNHGCSNLEFETLQRELEERNRQRDELLFRVKTLTDKTKQYKAKLEKEETNKRQQIRILQKTHETLQKDKQCLIDSLQDLLEEHEARHEGKGDTSVPSVRALTDQILTLQTQKHELSRELLDAKADLQETSARNLEVSALQQQLANTEEEKQQLQDELIKRWTLKVVTETEKVEDEYRAELTKCQHALREAEVTAVRLRLEAESAQQRRDQLEAQMHEQLRQNQSTREESSALSQQLVDLANRHGMEQKSISAENEQLREEAKHLRAEVENLRKKLESSNKAAAQKDAMLLERDKQLCEIDELGKDNMRLTAEVTSLMAHHDDSKREVLMNKEEIASLQKQLLCFGDIQADRDELSASLTEEKTRSKDLETVLEQQKRQNTDLEQALRKEKEHAADCEHQILRYKKEIATIRQQMEEEVNILHEAKEAELKAVQEQRDAELSHKEAELHAKKVELRAAKSQKEEELRLLQRNHERSSRDMRNRLASINQCLVETQRALVQLRSEYDYLRCMCEGLPSKRQQMVESMGKMVLEAIQGISEYNVDLVRKYRREMQLRKKFHNELVELRGNIRVFCRVRPSIREDGCSADSASVVMFDSDDDAIISVLHRDRWQSFELDKVFTWDSDQEQVFQEVQALVTSSIDGFNVCIFAYGQTGSGKTYTMEGTRQHPGINQRALKELFRETQERSRDWHFTINVSVMEIYNENIRDLLSSDGSKLDVKMNPEGGGLYVPGLVTYEVTSVNDVNQVFLFGQENRATAATNMNEHSSRSHALLCVSIEGVNKTTGARSLGKLNLVDLAGSERVSKSGAEGARLREAQSINKSLATLGDVIHALRNKQGHIPYRNSKLTYLLQDSLGGDSKTLMIVQVAPVEKNVVETLASLNFAQRVRAVELGQASRRVDDGLEPSMPLKGSNKANIMSKSSTKGLKK